jgi:hypothetical protein
MSNPLCEAGVVIETKIMTTNEINQQLELGFNATQSRIYGRKRETRVARAKWWFARMRAAVANAARLSADGETSAEQIFFSGVNRELKA